MRANRFIPTLIALVLASAIAGITATLAVSAIEKRSHADVTRVLGLNGFGWANADVNGLQVTLIGEAPDEANRFRALSIAGTVIDAARLIDEMDVADREAIVPPRFSIEILRNDDGVSLIGLIPTSMDRENTLVDIFNIVGASQITDLMETADFPVPEGWDNAIAYGMAALGQLPRSKISISANRVELKAISDSVEQKRKLEAALSRHIPDGLLLSIDITAPRPVITPFTLRFLIDDEGARFDACSTDTAKGRARILEAAEKAGLEGIASCTIGLGVPTHDWDDAVITGIEKLAEIGGGTITFSDADISLIAPETTSPAVFDKVVGELEASLPDIFSVHAVLTEPKSTNPADQGPPEFVATRSPEGLVQLRGRIGNERGRVATESFARAQFGSKQVTGAMRLDDTVPNGWSTRVLASLEALAYLNNGSVVMQPDLLEIKGTTGDPNARAEISRLLSDKLGAAKDFKLSVVYEKKLDPVLDLPNAAECVQRINLVLSIRQITFAPSSADIEDDARDTVDNIAEIMKNCYEYEMEIGGHTDSQGRETMNLALSQSRANAVVNALLARRVLTSNLTALGYGEAIPVADNGTESGRELNRRIEFKLILEDEPTAPTDTVDETTLSDTQETEETQTEATDEQN